MDNDKQMDNDPQIIQYAYRWGNSPVTPWVDMPHDGEEVEVHAGFFMRARIKPQRCPATLGMGTERVSCERPDHGGPGEDPIHEAGIGQGLVIRWTDAVPRAFPRWDGTTEGGR